MTDTSLYETDIVAWADRQVEELRRLAEAGVTNSVDWANVIEEIESVGRSEWRGVRSQLVNTLTHILKGVCDHDSLSRVGWEAETVIFLGDARDDFRPSMRRHLDLDEAWQSAFRRATDSLRPYGRLIPPGLPKACPFTLDELAKSFNYNDAVAKLHALTRKR